MAQVYQQSPQLLVHRQANDTMTAMVADENDDWVLDSVVDAALQCKKLFTRHTCRLCQVYVDRQVEYEQSEEESQYDNSNCSEEFPKDVPKRHHQHQHRPSWLTNSILQGSADQDGGIASSLEVELYRQFLFDEESVVEVIEEREKEDASQASQS